VLFLGAAIGIPAAMFLLGWLGQVLAEATGMARLASVPPGLGLVVLVVGIRWMMR
jgi:hypothetical protein